MMRRKNFIVHRIESVEEVCEVSLPVSDLLLLLT